MPFKNKNIWKWLSERPLLFGFKISFTREKNLSIAALDGMAVLYSKLKTNRSNDCYGRCTDVVVQTLPFLSLFFDCGRICKSTKYRLKIEK